MKIVKNKKVNYKKIYYFVSFAILLVLISIVGVKIYFDFFANNDVEVETRKNLDTLDLYGYTLDDSDTELYKKYFDELKVVLDETEVDNEKYASLLTQLFVVDVYNLNNKLASTDIGGLEFIHNDLVENFKINLGDTMYNTIESNINGNRTQKLPVVTDVVISNIEEITYEYNDIEYNGYEVSASWTYEEDLGYEDSAQFILISDNNKLNIVEKVDGE